MVLFIDIIFLTVAVIVTATGAMMALLVNLVLPGHYWDQSKSEYAPFPVLEMNSWETIDIPWMGVGRTIGDIRQYPYLVSISSYPYLDSKKHCLFLCTGAIVSLDGEVMVFTGSGCNLENHKHLVVRGNSDFFWKDGKVSKISSIQNDGDWTVLKLEQDVGTPAAINLSEKVPANSKFYGLGWGAEVRPNVDILSNEKFYVETWGTSYEDMCKNTHNYCNYFFFTHQITKFFIEAMDDKLTCCYEAYITHTNDRSIRNVHGKNIGKPLVYIDPSGKPIVIAMQHRIGFRVNDTVGYYTVFNAVAPNLRQPSPDGEEETEAKEARGKEKEMKEERGKEEKSKSGKVKRAPDTESRGPRLIATRIYKVQNVKKFFLQWFRYSGTKDWEQYANYDPELWRLEKKPHQNASIICYTLTNSGDKIKHDYEITITERPFLP
nr:unnamed protein product [Callosobruchus chinensis]